MKKILLFLPLLFCIFEVKAQASIFFEYTKINVLVGDDIQKYLPKAYYFKDGNKCDDDIIYDYGIEGTTLGIVNTKRVGTYRVICKATNNEREISVVDSIYFNVIDIIPPTIYDYEEIRVEYGVETNIIDFISWSDNYYEEIDIEMIGEINFYKVGVYKVSYKAIDGSNNYCCKSGVVYVEDKEKPYMIYDDLYLNANSDYDLFAGLKTYDNADDNVKVRISDDDIDITKKGKYYAEYVIWDKSQNIVVYKRDVYVDDFEGPKIILKDKKIIKKPNEIIDYKKNILEVKDNYNSLLIDSVKIEVEEKKQGTFIITYSLFDGSGNYGESKCEVTSIDDTPPIIYGENKTIESLDEAMEGISASDNIEGDISNRIYITESNLEDKPGNYYITFEVYDLSGNYTQKTIFYTMASENNFVRPVFPTVTPTTAAVQNVSVSQKTKTKPNYIPYFILGGIVVLIGGKVVYTKIKKTNK